MWDTTASGMSTLTNTQDNWFQVAPGSSSASTREITMEVPSSPRLTCGLRWAHSRLAFSSLVCGAGLAAEPVVPEPARAARNAMAGAAISTATAQPTATGTARLRRRWWLVNSVTGGWYGGAGSPAGGPAVGAAWGGPAR